MTYGNRTTQVLTRRDHYAADFALVLRQTSDEQTTTLQVRRVNPPGYGEELQIEIEIMKKGEKRNTQMHASFILPPHLADQLAEACAKLREKAA